MPKDISGTGAFGSLREKTERYASLVNRAELCRRDNGGAASKQEAELYLQAMDVCDEIKNQNLSNRGVVAMWESKKEYCREQVHGIMKALGIEIPAQKETGGGGFAPMTNTVRNPANAAVSGSTGMVASTGFTTKNANEYVSAETIEKWYQKIPKNGIEDLVGMDEVVELLISAAGNMGFSETDELLHIDPGKGILLYGIHGNGKTTTVKAFVNYLSRRYSNLTFLQLIGSQVKDKFVGVAEKRVEAAFREAIDNAKSAPCVLFFDEIDNLCKNRSKASGNEASLTNAFIEAWNIMVEEKVPVIVIGATNNPWLLDPPVSSRFSAAKIYVKLPTEQARTDYFKKQFSNIRIVEDISCSDMAADTDNFDYRDLKGLSDALSGMLKTRAIRYAKEQKSGFDAMRTEEKDAIVSEALREGRVMLDRELYGRVRSAYHASLTKEETEKMEEYIRSLS